MRIVIFENADGTLQRLSFAMKDSDLDRMIIKFRLDGLHSIEVTAKDLPSETFRDAWRLVNNTVVIDLDAAKYLHKKTINESYNTALRVGTSPANPDLLAAILASHTAIHAATTSAELEAIKLDYPSE